jgi:hypothetical protein
MSWVITGTFKNKLLLDEYPGSAAAYSLRNLSILSTAPVVRVRRSSDNTESDFTATQVSDGTLTTFCGAGDGFVRTWYDQSGNARHAQQATTGSQPRVVAAGILETKGINSRPSIRFLSASLTNLKTSAFGGWDVDSMFIAASSISTAFMFDGNSINNISIFMPNGLGDLRLFAGTTFVENNIITPGALSLINTIVDSAGTDTLAVNADTRTANYGSNKRNGLTLGGAGNLTSSFLNDSISEVIIYPFDQSANRPPINNNINAHYAIY